MDISSWNGGRAPIRYYTCNQKAWLDRFTISEFEPGKLLASALVDDARKHRKRSPDEVARIQSERVKAR